MGDGADDSMTPPTSTRDKKAQLEKEQILIIINMIEGVCTVLLAAVKVLKGLL